MAARNEADAPPEEFRRAVDQLKSARLRPEILCEEMPAPQRIAPYSAAMTADVTIGGEEVGGGRLVLLYDPAGNDAWQGTFRFVAYARADIDPEMVTDPLLGAVGWTWLIESLGAHRAEFLAPSGTVTRVASESYGGMDGEPSSAEIEVRASWSPLGGLTEHVEAWGDLLCTAAGLPASPGRSRRDAEPPRPPGPMTEPGHPQAAEATPEPPRAPLLELSGGLPPVAETLKQVDEIVELFGAAEGPFAIDAERASGYRYSHRAYLVQMRRRGAGTALIDPIGFGDVPNESLQPLADAVGDAEWIIHAASQDIPCLAELGMRPTHLFDTELAGRLLNYPRVALAVLVEELLGFRMRKEHSAVDWSKRPLPEPWLHYAALDVEVLIELRDVLADQLDAAGKRDWANQEFAAWAQMEAAAPRREPWRRTSGIHRVRGRRGLALVRAMWELRDDLARNRDITTNRIVPDAALIEAAQASPTSRNALARLSGFAHRGGQRYVRDFAAVIAAAQQLPDRELPQLGAQQDGPPPPRVWADKNPAAAARLARCREAVSALAVENELPQENLVAPDAVRRLAWTPPSDLSVESVAGVLDSLAARPWQIELVSEALADALAD